MASFKCTLILSEDKISKVKKMFPLMGSFYKLDEYFCWISRSDLGTFIQF